MFGEYYYDNDEIYEIETFQSESDDEESNFSIFESDFIQDQKISFSETNNTIYTITY